MCKLQDQGKEGESHISDSHLSHSYCGKPNLIWLHYHGSPGLFVLELPPAPSHVGHEILAGVHHLIL